MKLARTILAAAAVAASFGASAAVTGQLGGGTGSFLALSGPAACTALTPCTLGGTVATIVGGTTYAADQTFADIPKAGTIFGGNFLAAGPTATQPATLTFTTPVPYISFLWGSPDMYNQLTVNYTGGSQLFTAAGLGFAVTDGNQAFSQYVEFMGTGGSLIQSLVFNNIPSVDAFESANFSVAPPTPDQRAAPVPEPGTYALILAGLGVVGFLSRRRKGA